MKKYSEFLIEKINRSEINAALKNTSIRIGAEYEFTLDSNYSINGGKFSEFNIDDLDQEYSDLYNEFHDNIKTVDKLGKKYYKDYIAKDVLKKTVYPTISKMIDKVKKNIKTREDILDDVFTTNKEELEAEIEELTRSELDLHQNEMRDFKDAYSSEDWETLIELLDEFEDDEGFEINYDAMNDYITNEGGYSGKSSSRELDNFYEVAGQDYYGTIDSAFEASLDSYIDNIGDYESFQDFADKMYDELEALDTFNSPSITVEYADEYGDYGGEEVDYGMLPFDIDDALVSSEYAANSGRFGSWRVETDPSVHGNGIEIISPVQTLKNGLSDMEDMFAFISDYGQTDSSAGFHINLSYKGKELQDADMLKLMLFMDEGQVWNLFKERKNNTYVKSVTADLNREVRSLSTILKRGKKNSKDGEAFFKYFIATVNTPNEKYFGVNLSNFWGSTGRIEFRYLGGSNYETKYNEIVAQIGRYVHLILIAFDPDYKRKEYVLKMNNLYNKIDAPKDKLEFKLIDQVINDGELMNGKLDIRKIGYGEYVYTIDTKNNKILTVKNRSELTKFQLDMELSNSTKRKSKTKGVTEYVDDDGMVYFISDKKNRLLKIEFDKKPSSTDIKRMISRGKDETTEYSIYKYAGKLYTIDRSKHKILKTEKS